MKIPVLFVGVVFAIACSSSDDGGGSTPDGGSGGTGGSGASGGSGGSAGQADSHCTQLSLGCSCVGDPDDIFSESEGTAVLPLVNRDLHGGEQPGLLLHECELSFELLG